jgi:hypothetical protein
VVAVDKQQQLKAGDEFLREIQDRLLQSQVTMKSYHDQHWHEVVFQEGDWVWLRLQQRTTVAISAAAHSKLSPKYYGPYKILQHISKISYKLELPSRAKIHNVFHVSVLKKYEGAAPKQIVPLPDLLHGRVLPTPDRVLRARLNKGVWELLVQWTGQPAANATWQPLEDFKVQFSWLSSRTSSLSTRGEMLWMPLWAGSTASTRQEGSTEVIRLLVSCCVSRNKGDDNPRLVVIVS